MPLLDWLNKDEAIKAANKSAYRLMEEVPELSYGDVDAGNLLIQGDNLEALKALLPFYSGKVKCVFIDPPYNTKSAFEHYDDNLEHSIWLSTIYPRLELLRELLAEDGSIWVTIDENESHYLKVVMDEIFGRKNFRADISWQRKYSVSNNFTGIASIVDHIYVYSKTDLFQNNLLPRTEDSVKRYSNPDDDPRGVWKAVDYLNQASPDKRPNLCYDIINPNTGKVVKNTTKAWKYEWSAHERHVAENRIWWGKDGNNKTPALKLFLSEVRDGMTPHNWWPHDDSGHTDEAKKEINRIFDSNTFDTPKPERLVMKALLIATNKNDLVLDSFLGSGTTAAVAHKMGRRYLGIEIGEHAVTHCLPRLKKVVDGEQGGISESVNWQGGGGFRFIRLGQKVFDEFGLLNPDIRFATLAAHIWFIETRLPLPQKANSSMIGVHKGVAYYLLYNGILGDKRPHSGNVLTSKVLSILPEFDGPKVIYGETTRLGEARLKEHQITFKQIPYDVKTL